MESLVLESVPQFDNVGRVDYRFKATQENIDKTAKYIKNLLVAKCNINIEIYRDDEDDEIILELYEL